MSDDYIVFGAPDIREPEIQEVVDTLRSGWIGTGPRVGRFEQAFAEYVGSRNAVAVHSCTAALHLSMRVAGVGPGDEVITSPQTFAATANAILHTGATPRFIDIRRDSQNLDPEAVGRFLEEECRADRKTGVPVHRASGREVRAIMPIHIAGRPAEVDAFRELCDAWNLLLIEDGAHAVGTEVGGRRVGSIGDLTCFSFYVTKNLVTGEGGMVTTDDDDLAARLKVFALHGLSADAWKRYSDEGFSTYEVVVPGFKANMMDLQAALGLHQLARQEEVIARREVVWATYDRELADLPLGLPAPPAPDTRHSRHLYTVMVDPARSGKTRDQVQGELHRLGIGTGIHYLPVHLHDYYRREFRYRRGDFPEAEWVGDSTLSIPLSSKLTEAQVARVVEGLRTVLAN